MATLLITQTGSLAARNLDGQGRKEKLTYETRLRALIACGHSVEAAEKLAACQMANTALPIEAAAELAHQRQANRNYIREIAQSCAPAPLIDGDAQPHGRIVRDAQLCYDNTRGWYEGELKDERNDR